MKILVAAGHLPSLTGRQAGAKTSYHLCEYFARRHEVHLRAFATSAEMAHFDEREMAIFKSWDLTHVTVASRVLGALRSPALPLSIAARNSGEYRKALREKLKTQEFDAVIFDHTAMFQYADEAGDRTVCIGSAHDVLSQLWTRRASARTNPVSRRLAAWESRRIRAWESKAFNAMKLLLPHCEKDKDLAESLVSDTTVMAISPWIMQLTGASAAHREAGAMLFWGAMNRAENADAARWAAEFLLPVIRRCVPEAKLYVAGSYSEALAVDFAGRPGVEVTGFVEDVEGLMSRMEIALLPLRLGAGIKVKTLECMSAGLPVVTTPIGAEGVGATHGVQYLIAEDADELAAFAVKLLLNPREAQTMGSRAREFVRQRHDFYASLDQVEAYLTKSPKIRERLVSA